MVNVVVSACLLGEPCRYDGESKPSEAVRALCEIEGVRLIPICPEVQGGLLTPRPPAEIQPGMPLRVVNVAGQDVTREYEEGASCALEAAGNAGASLAILKAKSPSCGSGMIYDGTFSGSLTEGWGVTAYLLRENGVKVFDENELTNLLMQVRAANREEWNNKVVELLKSFERPIQSHIEPMETKQDDEDQVKDENRSLEEPQELVEYIPVPLPPITAKKALGHFKTITKHKIEVAKLCFKIGLYSQALRHDLSKYTITEFSMGARFYQGFRSPNAAERECRGFTEAWLHHKGRNKHHFEYWLDLSDDPQGRLKPAPMPTKYVLEMLCDRIAASKTYKGADYTDADPYNYFDQSRGYIIMHPQTKAQIESLLRCLAEEGEGVVIAKAKAMYNDSKRK